jgi:hypothetical protein
LQLGTKAIDLLICEDADACQIAMRVEEVHLVVAEPVAGPILGTRGQGAKGAQGLLVNREIFEHDRELLARM